MHQFVRANFYSPSGQVIDRVGKQVAGKHGVLRLSDHFNAERAIKIPDLQKRGIGLVLRKIERVRVGRERADLVRFRPRYEIPDRTYAAALVAKADEQRLMRSDIELPFGRRRVDKIAIGSDLLSQ